MRSSTTSAPSCQTRRRLFAVEPNQEFVESQEAVLAVVTRAGERETEFLLVEHAGYGGYFFPTQRVKTEVKPAAIAKGTVRSDLGYHSRDDRRKDETEHEYVSRVPKSLASFRNAERCRQHSPTALRRREVCQHKGIAMDGKD